MAGQQPRKTRPRADTPYTSRADLVQQAAEARAHSAALTGALATLLARHADLLASGDLGGIDPEAMPEVQQARAVLGQPNPGQWFLTRLASQRRENTLLEWQGRAAQAEAERVLGAADCWQAQAYEAEQRAAEWEDTAKQFRQQAAHYSQQREQWQSEAEEAHRIAERLADDAERAHVLDGEVARLRRDAQGHYSMRSLWEGQVAALTDLVSRLQQGIQQRNEAFAPYLLEHGCIADLRGAAPDAQGVFHCPCAACVTAEALRSQDFPLVPEQEQAAGKAEGSAA